MSAGDEREFDCPQRADRARRRVLERLFRSEATGLARFMRSRIGGVEEVQDLVQEAFANLAAARPQILFDRPEAYLQRIARNLVFERYRRLDPRRSPRFVPVDEALSVAEPPRQEWAIEADDARARYLAVLDTLAPRTREIFLLHRVDGLNYAQIADHMDLTVKAVEYHMSRALAQLHKVFYGR